MKRLYKHSAALAVILSLILFTSVLASCLKVGPNGNPDSDAGYCVVTFVTNCSATVPEQTIETGGKVSEPNITIPGYTLDGWYAGDAKWNFNTDTVSGQTLTLTARWKKIQSGAKQVTVTFVTGCSATVPQQTVDVGGKVSEPNITNYGYTLDGWYTAGGAKWRFGVDTVSGETLTLTAHWTAIPVENKDVTVTFNVGLAARKVGVYNPAAVTTKAGNKITEPSLTRAGYTVEGWYVEDGSQKWDFGTSRLLENITLFAKWKSSSGTSVGYTPAMTENGTLYIHYLRPNNDYDGWAAWVWTTGNGKRYTGVTVDKSGCVIAVNLSAFSNPSSINFKIAEISASNVWGAEDGGDVKLNLADTQKVGGSYHWYVTQGNTASGSSAFAVSNSTTEPKRASISNVNRQTAKNLPVMNTVDGWDEMGVGYQIFVASFCDSNGDGVGDLNGITSKLDYLQSLNVDVLWLTPVQSSESYHGYDCYDYYSIDSKFGTNADYRNLVNNVHKRGMKIIMDLVVNHTSQQNEWFQKSKAGVVEQVTYQDGTKATVNYRDFYRWKNTSGNRYEPAGDGWYFYSSFGGYMPELNYDYQPVRDAMVDVAAYWMNYGLDGFRMDAIKHVFMWDESENAYGDVEGGSYDIPYNYNLTKNVEFFKEFNYRLKTKFPHCYLLGEQLNGDPSQVSPFYAGMDSLFDFNTYFNLPNRINGSDGGVGAQAWAFNNNAQTYANDRNGRPINSMISSNHDVDRLNAKIGGSTEKTKLYMAVILTMPGLPWIYYGDEIGLVGDKSNNKGDDGLRQSMKWTAGWANKCTAIWDYKINNNTKSVADQQKDSSSLLSYVMKLTKFRNDNPALISGTANCSEQDGMLKIVITGRGKTYTVYHNFSSGSKTVNGNVLFGSKTIPAYGTTIVG
ncbi:MAG: InlB B-repeat-containing protein [Clostridia bacterium]|nr:InlB B-repeat-containing protein [Clostridia bacterium]